MNNSIVTAALVAMQPEGATRSMIENGQLIVSPQLFDHAERVARAVVLAMREPTEEMLTAGGEGNSTGDYPQPSVSWPRMIDEVLK